MNREIRKISVGKNYPDGAMHYQVGSTIHLKRVPYTVVSITEDIDEIDMVKIYDIVLMDNTSPFVWKTIKELPVVIEYNIDFD